MPKYSSYVVMPANTAVRKGVVASLVAPLRGDSHEIIESVIDRKALPSDLEMDPDDAEAIFLRPDRDVVWTYGVATCHVVCMYGWLKTRVGNTDRYTNGVALLHLTDAHTLEQGLKECKGVLDDNGYSNNITSYIIGGQPSSSYKFGQLTQQMVVQYGLRGVVQPLTTNGGGAACVIAKRTGMAFHVYDESQDTE